MELIKDTDYRKEAMKPVHVRTEHAVTHGPKH